MIEVRELRKYYEMGDSVVHALDGVDLDIAAGEFVSITGASGSGKSTMMHLLGCLDRPTSGRYSFKGQAINTFNAKQLARVRSREIGFVFQTFNLINRTSVDEDAYFGVLDGVALAFDAHRRDCETFSDRSSDLDEIERLMKGFADELRKLEEGLRIVSAYVTRMHSKADHSRGRLLH